MKVNMALIADTDEDLLDTDEAVIKDMKAAVEADMKEDEADEEEDDEEDESDKHSKIKTLLLIAAMVGGLGLFVWNMTGLVNNMRLDDQGYAVNVVYDMEDLGSFMDSSNSSGSVTVPIEQTEGEVTTDAARDGPDTETDDKSGSVSYANESEEITVLRQEVEDALNEAALVRQELKNAEDMLDSSLQREAELQEQIDTLTGEN